MGFIYLDDHRYPGPEAHPPPAFITGLPTQAELEALPRMFTWGELKGFVKHGKLELLMRNRIMQAKYDKWSAGMKLQYGSTEKYLTQARLPWKAPQTPAHVYPGATAGQGVHDGPAHVGDTGHQPSEAAHSKEQVAAGRGATPLSLNATGPSTPQSQVGSGTSTPASAGFVSLASLQGKLKRLAAKPGQGLRPGEDKRAASSPLVKPPANGQHHAGGGSEAAGGDVEDGDNEDDEPEELVFLKYDPAVGLDHDKFAVLPNDWPYNIPHGVQHFCIWSRVPIAHPCLIDYDPVVWAQIEDQGLSGFTGVTPIVLPESISRASASSSPSSLSSSAASSPREPESAVHGQVRPAGQPAAAPVTPPNGLIGATAPTLDLQQLPSTPSPNRLAPAMSPAAAPPSPLEEELDPIFLLQSKAHGRQAAMGYKQHEWYPADVRFGGAEMRKWAGVEYESPGGQEVGRMVKALWDERGWECIWFVNPPRLQSVPGFSHFHIFARRKTPEEIDAAEHVWGTEPRNP